MDDIAELSADVVAHYSGPDHGINDISLVPFRQALNTAKTAETSSQTPSSSSSTSNPAQKSTNTNGIDSSSWESLEKSGIDKFNVYHHRAYGIACSLYENNPNTSTTVGDPIADVFAILARKNSSIMALSDGVNWGPRSRLAARCAVRACVNHINKHLFQAENPPTTTHDVFKVFNAYSSFNIHSYKEK